VCLIGSKNSYNNIDSHGIITDMLNLAPFICLTVVAMFLTQKNWVYLTNLRNREKLLNIAGAIVTVGSIAVCGYSLLNNVEENTQKLDKLERKIDSLSSESKAMERSINAESKAMERSINAESKAMERSINSRFDSLLQMMSALFPKSDAKKDLSE